MATHTTDNQNTTSKATNTQDPTFRNYALKAAADYAALRPAYSPQLVDLVLTKHKSTGGKFDTLLDVGCGPGTATRQFALHFQKVTGADPGESMISVARGSDPAVVNANGAPANFVVCAAEDIHTIATPASIDLIIVATALHWFDLSKFYAAAARALKPSGSLAIWIAGSLVVDPETTPNAGTVQREFDWFEKEALKAYELPGNRASRELYENLATPWTLDASTTSDADKAAVAEFDKTNSERIVYNLGGAQEPSLATENNPKGFLRAFKAPISALRQSIGTASQVTRWREAHKEALEKGEVEDVVDVLINKVRAAMAEVPEGKDREWIDMVTPMVLIIYKKKAASL